MIGWKIEFDTAPDIYSARIIAFTNSTAVTIDSAPSPAICNTTFHIITTADQPSFNSWMEDCVVEQPYSGPGREVTFVIGGGVNVKADSTIGAKLHLEPFGCGIPDC